MIRYLLFILLLFISFSISSQEMVFKTISAKDGLSQNDVNCILQDGQGFMWFGTYDGLNRYDGYEFKSYHLETETNKGLNSNLIQCIAEDEYKNIWVGTSDRGLNIIRYKDEKVVNVIIPGKGNSDNLLEKEKVIGVDINKGKAVVFTKEKIFLLNASEKDYEAITTNTDYRKKKEVYAINCFQKISDNEYLLGTSNSLKLVTLDYKNSKIEIRDIKKWLNVSDIKPFREGYLISCAGKLLYLNQDFNLKWIAHLQFSSLLVEDREHVWIGNRYGLHYIKFEKGSLKIKKKVKYSKETTNGQLKSNTIKCLFKDNSGLLWLGTANRGVVKMTDQLNKFKLYKNLLASPNLKNNHIKCFFEDSEGNLWFGTDKQGISYFNSSIKNYNTEAKEIMDSEKDINNINCFHEFIMDGETYIITTTNYPINIRFFNLKGEKVENKKLKNAFDKITHPVNSIASDSQYLWIGTNEGGLIRYDYINDDFKRYLTKQIPTLASNLIRNICVDSKNRVWVGTNKGLNLITPQERHKTLPKFKLYTHISGDSSSLSYDYILPIIETEKQEIWIGTLGGGLNKYVERSNSFIHWTTQDGLPNNNIKSIVEDDANKIWISTNKGISCLNPNSNKITNYKMSDGLQDNEFREMAGIKRKSGELLFGGNNGFNSFFPDQLKPDTTTPTPVFTKMIFTGSSENEDLELNRAQLLEYQQNNIAIKRSYQENSFTGHFSGLHYPSPQKTRYKYRLSGFEEKWNKIDAQSRFAKYTNLNPGKYTLEVLASNEPGIWSDAPLSLKIQINKPWYKTSLAFILYTILIFSLLYLSKRYSLIRNKIKEELLMERFEKEKEKELTQVKLRFFTNISHELRTPLTIIKGYFDHIIPQWETLPKEKVNKDFTIIERNVDNLLRLLGQILDFRKLEQNKMKLLPKERNIIEFIDTIISSFQFLAESKNIDLQFIHKSEAIPLWFDLDKMDKIISNLLSNAIKYTSQGGQIAVTITERKDDVKIEVSDNGIGIPDEDKKSVFKRFYQVDSGNSRNMQSTGIGLSLTKGLVNLHKGNIELESKEGEGSTFVLYFRKGNIHFKNSYSEPVINEVTETNIKEEVSLTDNKAPSINSNYKEKLVLIVEDNDDLRSFLQDKLGNIFKVITANNGKQGLAQCEELLPDLVISDIMMPEMDGYELCDSIKNSENISHIPVILLTAKTNSASKLQGFQLGADAYVNKPFELDILIAQIIAILETREKIWKRIGENPFFKASDVTFTTRDEQFLNRITALIEENMSNTSFTVEQLAGLYECSQDSLNKKIKALTGKTCVQYIRLIRLRKAAQLLKNPHNRVSEVTYEVGYSDLQHFREHFKKEFTLTPAAYKKQNAK